MRVLSRVDGQPHVTPYGEPPTKYAILSHRWLAEHEEVTYRDVKSGDVGKSWFSKQGLKKLNFCLDLAADDGIGSVWIDSCCIDRTDQHELGKSINQMYNYYKEATVCYVYLPDVRADDWQQTLAASQWFKRGWTLQELVAPPDVRFYTCDREYIGDKHSLTNELLRITGIDLGLPVQDVPIPRRFRWSLNRATQEPEDISYCLLGILEVSIAANYGEGADMARERLLDAVEREHGRKAVRQILATSVPSSIKAPSMSGRETSGHSSSEVPLTIPEILNLLHFPTMYARRADVSDPFLNTCEWLLKHPDYRAWMDMNLHFLWIKGKPGAGKSTLMKHAARSAHNDCIRIHFFFNARGENLEKSVEGMYRALLHQLLRQANATQEPVYRFFAEEKKCTGDVVLSLPVLQAAFRIAVRSITGPVQCFIDALDECDYSELQDMVHFLEDVSFETRLHVCFASRYYPSITIRSKELLLEEQPEQGQDLIDYVEGRLKAPKSLQKQVIDKANGVFLWATVVVRLLNEESSAGRSYNFQDRLDQLPSELNDLLRAIIAPAEHTAEFRLAIQWISFAKRPLSAREYYAAIILGLHMQGSTTQDPFEAMEPDAVMMKKFIASSSRGLAELTQSGQVQYIHESVRDFLLCHGGLHEILPMASGGMTTWIHNELHSMCVEYMKGITLATLRGRRHDATVRFAFREYCITSLLYHADAGLEGQSRKDFVQAFKALLVDWQRAFPQMHSGNDPTNTALIDAATLISQMEAITGAVATRDGLLLLNSYLCVTLNHYCRKGRQLPLLPYTQKRMGIVTITAKKGWASWRDTKQ